jgi:2-phosphosulfolactate phosphatase
MKIVTTSLVRGAREAEGTVVIIDVLRAATTASYLLAGGAERIIAVERVQDAFDLKLKHPSYILVGELKGRKVPGFDYGNSPSAIRGADIRDKTIIFRTSSGVSGIMNAKKADVILFAGFVNAQATADYLKKKKPSLITLVGMGWEGTLRACEDDECAQYIKNTLNNITNNQKAIKKSLLTCKTAEKFFEDDPDFPEIDFELSLEFDRFDFAIRALKQRNQILLAKA